MRSKFLVLSAVLTIAVLAGTRSAAADDGQDRVSFGSRIVIGENESAGDVVCFFCSVEAHGKIQGDVVTFFGSVKSTGPIQGDVVSFLGDVALNEDASVGGDLVIFGGSLRKNLTAHIGQDQVIFPVVIFMAPILIFVGIIWGISVLFRRRAPVFYIPPTR
jgi:hypothetical protein